MKFAKMIIAIVVLSVVGMTAAEACPRGQHPHGGVGSHHRGGYCSYDRGDY